MANIVVPTYQVMVSLTGFTYPMFILLAGRAGYAREDSYGFGPTVIFTSAVLVLILLDIFAFGAEVRFRIQVAWLPVVVDLFVFMVSVSILVFIAAGTNTLREMIGTSNVGGAIALAVLYALIWSTVSAIITILLTRATDCCFPYYDPGSCDEEDPALHAVNYRQRT